MSLVEDKKTNRKKKKTEFDILTKKKKINPDRLLESLWPVSVVE